VGPKLATTSPRPRLDFQPIINPRNFNSDIGAEIRSATCEALASGSPEFDNCGWLAIDGLREGISRAEKQGHY
jgi:hypothetical protein